MRTIWNSFTRIGACVLACSLLVPALRAQSQAPGTEQGYTREAVSLRTEDGQSRLVLKYSSGARNPKWGCVIMHPASDSRLDWRLPYFAKAGIVSIGMNSRYFNDVAHEFYEPILLDIAAAVKYLREVEKVEKVLLLGHSGGGSLMVFYAQQSAKKIGERSKAPVSGTFVDWQKLGFEGPQAGNSVVQTLPDLNKVQLPPVDLLIISSSHYGAGWALLRKIDPSVTDENDPTSADPSLDMYNPANGFKAPPESSKYSEEFLRRYRKAQEERTWRLIRRAQSMIAEKKLYVKMMEDPGFKNLPQYDQILITRKAITQQYITIYRLLAIPNFTDLSIEPNDRVVGSNQGPRPDKGNYSQYFHPAYITPESLVSAEGPTSPINIPDMIKDVTIPTLIITGTADMQEYPSEREAMLQASPAKVKEMVWIEGANHGYMPQGPKAGEGKQRDRAADAMVRFIKKAYPNTLATN